MDVNGAMTAESRSVESQGCQIDTKVVPFGLKWGKSETFSDQNLIWKVSGCFPNLWQFDYFWGQTDFPGVE